MDHFLNRTEELAQFDSLLKKNGLVVVFGRRRIGKTRLLTEWLNRVGGIYVQAIEGNGAAQLAQISQDIQETHSFGITPKTWNELFKLLDSFPGRLILAIDEFPYLVDADSSVPSIFQKWLDHRKKKDVLLILSGSSQKMMHDLFLNRSTPLYGRAILEIKLSEMGYPHFCKALGLKTSTIESFLWFSVTGGIPWYWTLMDPDRDLLWNLDRLYFGSSAILENEAKRLLSDEKIGGLVSLSVLEMVGRGASKPSEVASRLEIPQTQLSKTFGALTEAGFLEKEVPFGQSKGGIYAIRDSVLRFWFKVCSPHHSRWPQYSKEAKLQLIRTFASQIFESHCREFFRGSQRYWEGDLEFDAVVPATHEAPLRVVEAKFGLLTAKERASCLKELSGSWGRCKLASRHLNPQFEVFDFSDFLRGVER